MEIDNCNHLDIYSDEITSERVCRQCGLVLSDDHISEKPGDNAMIVQWGIMNDKQGTKKNVRNIQPPTMNNGSIFYKTDPANNNFKQRGRRLQNHQSNASGTPLTEVNHNRALLRCCSELGIPTPIKARAMYILERLGGNYKQIGKSYNLIAGALLLACREANYFVLTITDIANWFNEHRHRVATKWIAEAIMEMKPFLQEQIAKMLTPTTEQYLPHLSNKLWESLGNTFNLLEFLQNANDLLKKISKEQRGHRNPRTFAVSIIYLTANQMGIPLTQKTASELYKVSDYSFRENAIWIRRTFP